MKHYIANLFFLLLLFALVSCKDDSPAAFFEQVPLDTDEGNESADTLNPSSIQGLHAQLFETRCALSGCHDGNFEPDFRTIQSSFYTLVWHPVVKAGKEGQFKYRVVPFEPEQSVLYERITNCCFVNENDRMPQDNIGTPLADELIKNVEDWIKNGAKNIDGQVLEYPNREVNFRSYYVYNSDGDDVFNWLSATKNLGNGEYRFELSLEDDGPLEDLEEVVLKVSTTEDYENPTAQFTGQYDNGWFINVSTNGLPTGERLFFRFYAKDGDKNFEMPNDEVQKRIREARFSFFVN